MRDMQKLPAQKAGGLYKIRIEDGFVAAIRPCFRDGQLAFTPATPANFMALRISGIIYNCNVTTTQKRRFRTNRPNIECNYRSRRDIIKGVVHHK